MSGNRFSRRDLLKLAGSGVLSGAFGQAGATNADTSGRMSEPNPSAPSDLSAVLESMDGSGTEADPYQITDDHELQAMAASEGLSAVFELVTDIDASLTGQWNGGEGFQPVGTFEGVFDGRGHRISGLTVSGGIEVGLFGTIGPTGTVRDINLVDVDITGSIEAGSLAGESEGLIRQVSVTGQSSIDGSSDTGGLVGENQGRIQRSSVTGQTSVSGNSDTGGLVGRNRGSVTQSSVTGQTTVNGGGFGTGGLVGENDQQIERAFVTANVTVESDGDEVGGLVGENDGTVSESFAASDVTGEDEVGGLVGSNDETLTNSYASGDVVARRDEAGGLVGDGDFGTIRASYSIGTVEAPEGDEGGLVGDDDADEVQNSYWDIDTSGKTTSAGGIGLSTGLMVGNRAKESMSGFDFDNIWQTTVADKNAPEDGYPILRAVPREVQLGAQFGGDELTATVTGVVTIQRQEFAAPQEGVTVEFRTVSSSQLPDPDEKFTAVTDEDGIYNVELPAADGIEYDVVVDTEESVRFEDRIAVEPDTEIRKDIPLDPRPLFRINEIRPVQVVFDTGITSGRVDLVENKQTALLVYPEIENVDAISDQSEVSISVTGVAGGGSFVNPEQQWDGTLIDESVTLSKSDLQSYVTDIESSDDDTNFLGRTKRTRSGTDDVIAGAPLIGTVEIPDGIPSSDVSGTLGVEVTTEDDIRIEPSPDDTTRNSDGQGESGSVVTDVRVQSIDPIELVFFRDAGELTAPRGYVLDLLPESGTVAEVTRRELERHVREARKYLTSVLPIADDDLKTTIPDDAQIRPTANPKNPTRSDGASRTLNRLREAAKRESEQVTSKERVWGVGIFSTETMDYLGKGAGFTQAAGEGAFSNIGRADETTYKSILVENQYWVTTAHELGHQLGLYNKEEEYDVREETDQLENNLFSNGHSINGYWVSRERLLVNESSQANEFDSPDGFNGRTFMEKPGTENGPLERDNEGIYWLSNDPQYENVCLSNSCVDDQADYDVMFNALRSPDPATDGGDADTQTPSLESKQGTGEVRRQMTTDRDRRQIHLKGFVYDDEGRIEPPDAAGGTVETSQWHLYNDEAVTTEAPGGDYAIVGRDESGEVIFRKRFESATNGCGGQEGSAVQLPYAPFSLTVEYPDSVTTLEMEEVSAQDQATAQSTTTPEDDQPLASFDARVGVLRGELNSIPSRAFESDEPEEVRADLHDIISRVASQYDADNPREAARTIQTEFRPALDAALVEDYDANEPLERSRESVASSVDDTVDRSIEDTLEPTEYAGADGVVRLGGLREAVADWRADLVGDDVLSTVIDSWRRLESLE